MSQSGVYAEGKMVWWWARERKLPDAPKQVQLILSDLCNQDCVAEGTLIDSPYGQIAVEHIKPGDKILGLDGNPVVVSGTGWRVSESLYEVTIGRRTLYLTGEHPLLTQGGWKQVRDLSRGDAVAVRLRMRQDASLESSSQTVGKIPVRARTQRRKKPIRRQDVHAEKARSGQPASLVPVRLRQTREDISAWSRSLLGGLSAWSSTRGPDRTDVRGGPTGDLGTHENTQPDATAWDCRKGKTVTVRGNLAIQAGTEIHCLCELAQHPPDIHGRRDAVDSTQEPGLSRAESEEGHRSDDVRDFQRPQDRAENPERLRRDDGCTLPQARLELPRSVLPSGQSEAASVVTSPDPPRLCIAGITLERGLGFERIDSLRVISGRFKVYDITCPPIASYVANGVTVSNCHFCAYRMSGYTSNELFVGSSEKAAFGHNNPKRWIPTDRALALLDEFKELGVLSVQFTGGGEPTVHPEHERIFEKALDLGLRCSLVSNGVKWSKHLILDLLPEFDWVRVSIDAGTPESYAFIRHSTMNAWNSVWEHVAGLAHAIELRGYPTALGLGFVVTPESYEEILAFTAKARESGAHNVRFTAMFSPENETPYLAVYDDIVGLIHRARRMERPGFAVHDNFGSRFDDLKQHAPDYSMCSYQHYTAYVGGDLNAYRCCVLAYNKRGLVEGGNLKERSFAEFWRSQERKDDMNALDARGCERCQFNQKNRQLLYVMGDTASDVTPRHLEWP